MGGGYQACHCSGEEAVAAVFETGSRHRLRDAQDDMIHVMQPKLYDTRVRGIMIKLGLTASKFELFFSIHFALPHGSPQNTDVLPAYMHAHTPVRLATEFKPTRKQRVDRPRARYQRNTH